jgi:predicted transcriptional regulator
MTLYPYKNAVKMFFHALINFCNNHQILLITFNLNARKLKEAHKRCVRLRWVGALTNNMAVIVVAYIQAMHAENEICELLYASQDSDSKTLCGT